VNETTNPHQGHRISAVPSDAPPRVLVVGCGGIGGIVTACLHEQSATAGSDITAYTTNTEIAGAVAANGLRVTGVEGSRTVRGRCITRLDEGRGPYDYILLATQPPQVEDAAREAVRYLAPDGRMVCFQNGLCEERVARIAGEGRVLGAVVAWGAAMPEPGVYERTAGGGFTLGRMDGRDDPKLAGLALLLEAVGPVTVTQNLAGARWSKLAINCAISTLGTIGGDRLGTLMMSLTVRRLVLRIMTEVVRVAHAEKVRLEKVSGTLDLDWIALTETEEKSIGSPALVTKHAMLLAVGARYRRMRSSMLSAIERGRPPAVDFLNGEVVERGARHGIPTPVNAEAQRMVHAIARGEMPSSMQSIYALGEKVGARG
jgi:2-dehydropantoate 2-reductase